MARVADPIFSEPRLAAIYDEMDPDRSDLDFYHGLVEEFGARSVIDIGCGTGTFACALALTGVTVTGVDPAAASLDVARTKPGSELVTWIYGDASHLLLRTGLEVASEAGTARPPETGAPLRDLGADLAVMTANVAQVFLTDAGFSAMLTAIAETLRPGGHLAFEVRDPARRAWEGWHGHTNVQPTATEGIVSGYTEVTVRSEQLVSFRQSYRFRDGVELHSDSTLRFRERREIDALLEDAGFDMIEVRDAPDRPGLEWVFVARVA